MVLRRQPVGAELDRIITEMHERGDAPTDISHRCGVRVFVIRQRMLELGLEERVGAMSGVHAMWKEEDPNKLREAIWKKQREGAAETRRQHRQEARRARV